MEMKRDYSDFFFLDGTSADDGCSGRRQPLLCRPEPAEVTGDSSELDGLGATAPANETEPKGEEPAETSLSSCSSCLCSFSTAGQQQHLGAPGATSMPSGDQVPGSHGGRLGDELQNRAREGRDGYTSSSEEDEADSWRAAVTGGAARTGGSCSGASGSSDASCVVEFNRWVPSASGWIRRLRRNNNAAGAAPVTANRAETDRAFWEACLSSGYP